MKKIIYGVLIAIMAAALAACSESKSNKKETDDFDFETESKSNKWDEYTEYSELHGKKVSELLEEGYTITGYSASDFDYVFYFDTQNIDDADKKKTLELEGLTIKELIEKDIIFTNSIGLNGNYLFTGVNGSLNFSFQINGCAEIIEKYDMFTDIEDMEELSDMPISKVTIDNMEYQIVLDESAKDILATDPLSSNWKELLKDCTVIKCYYKPIPD